MLPNALIIFLVVHVGISLAYLVMILWSKSALTNAYILPILLIPGFGPLAGLAAEWQTRKNDGQNDPSDEIDTLSLSEDIYLKTIQRREESRSIVPLEEALIVNDRSTRKKLIFEMLLDDPMKNIDILLLARENNDPDTAHYANTTIAKIQSGFQLQLQQLAVQYEKNPKNEAILDRYIDVLNRFIESGLSEAYLQHKQRLILETLLDHKISHTGSHKETLKLKIRNSLALKNFSEAHEAAEKLKTNFPDDEDTWVNQLLVGVETRDEQYLDNVRAEIRRKKIDWSPANLEIVQPWLEVSA